MSYLKLIVNALWAGLYAACLVTLLIVFLNPALAARGVVSALFVRSFLSLAVIYVPLVALLLPSLFMCVRFFAARRLGTTWLNTKAIVWFCTVTLGAMTVAAYHNLRWTSSLVPPAAHDAFRMVCATMAGCTLIALCGASIAQLRPAAGRPLRIGSACALALPLLIVTLLMPVAGRHRPPGPESRLDPVAAGTGPSAAAGRLLLIGIDGASMDYILPLASTRELPTFASLMKTGASARLNSIRPCAPRVAWTSLLTGTPPWSSGVKGIRLHALPAGAGRIEVLPGGFGLWRLAAWGYISSHPLPPDARRVPTLWEILRWSGEPVETVGFDDAGDPVARAGTGAPATEVERRVAQLLGRDGSSPTTAGARRVEILRGAVAADLAARAAARELRRPALRQARMVAVRFRGLAPVSRYFLAYHLPEMFGDVREADRELFGRVLTGYYKLLDDLIAEQIELAGPDTFVMVVSPHGVEPSSDWKRLLGLLAPDREAEAPEPSGEWRRGPDGILLVSGAGVIPEGKVDDADLVDAVPTALYALGLPIKAGMRGDLLRRLFDRTFLETHPVHFVPAYGTPPVPAR